MPMRFPWLFLLSATAVLVLEACTREQPLQPMVANVVTAADSAPPDTTPPDTTPPDTTLPDTIPPPPDSQPPPNDNIANATFAFPLPFADSADITFATVEPGEPGSFCHDSLPPSRSVWYVTTAHQPGTAQLTAQLLGGTGVLAVYFDSAGAGLLQVGCNAFNGPVTFNADSGLTFFFQVSDRQGVGGPTLFRLLQDSAPPPPPPQASFFTFPFDPSIFDLVQFIDQSFDPGGFGIQSWQWSFGDGATATGPSPTHRYAADGDYQVELIVTTFDGRIGSTSRTVSVRTRDVAITRFQTPVTGITGKASRITVDIQSNRHPETVVVQLFKSVPGGSQLVATSTQTLPVRNRVSTVLFSYTFTPDDANIGKVTFRAVAIIVGGRDALPADNVAIGEPTKVIR